MSFTARNTAQAMMAKSTQLWRNFPYWMRASRNSIARSLKSRPPTSVPTNGITMSLTSEATILPNAAPMMTPTARSTTLPFIANSRNSLLRLIVRLPGSRGWKLGGGSAVGHFEDLQPLVARGAAQRHRVALARLEQRAGDRRDPGHPALRRLDLVDADDRDAAHRTA